MNIILAFGSKHRNIKIVKRAFKRGNLLPFPNHNVKSTKECSTIHEIEKKVSKNNDEIKYIFYVMEKDTLDDEQPIVKGCVMRIDDVNNAIVGNFQLDLSNISDSGQCELYISLKEYSIIKKGMKGFSSEFS